MIVLIRLRESFWFVPAALCLLSAGLAQGLVAADRRLPDDIGLVQVGAAGSRDLLSAIAGSMLAVASTTFSITVAVMALSSSTYGPRLVRNFMADRGNQVVLGVFVSTFLYALLVLRSVRADDEEGVAFVPHLAVNVAVLLAVAAVGLLVYFIHHVSDSIQVATLSQRLRDDLRDVVERLFPAERAEDGGPVGAASHDPRPDLGPDHLPVKAPRAGYVVDVDENALLALAARHDLVVVVGVRPGDYVLANHDVARIVPPSRATVTVLAAAGDAITVADARHPHADIDFAVQQLEEMAVRALSPGTNDPYTAVNALDHLSSGLSLLATRPTPPTHLGDEEGRLRVVVRRVVLGDLLDRVFEAMRLYAVEHPLVLRHTLTLGERVGRCSRDRAVHGALRSNAGLLVDAYALTDPLPHDLGALRRQEARLAAQTEKSTPCASGSSPE